MEIYEREKRTDIKPNGTRCPTKGARDHSMRSPKIGQEVVIFHPDTKELIREGELLTLKQIFNFRE